MPLAGNYNPATAQSEANLPPREDSVVQKGDLCGFYVPAFMEAAQLAKTQPHQTRVWKPLRQIRKSYFDSFTLWTILV